MKLNTILQNHHGHRNTIEDLANKMTFLLARNFISIHAKTWSIFVSKESVQ